MELSEVISGRYSARSYSKAPVREEDVQEMLESASLAPTSCNLQVHQFILVDDATLLSQFSKMVTGKVNWTAQLFVLVVDKQLTFENHANYISAGMAVQNLMLKAHEIGILTCPIAGFKNKNQLKKLLQIPPRYDVPLLIFFGYPGAASGNTKPFRPYRKPRKFSLAYNRFCDLDQFPVTSRISAWRQEQILEYRNRIFQVYYPRMNHSIFGDGLLDAYRNLLGRAGSDEEVLFAFLWEKCLFDEMCSKKRKFWLLDVLPDYLRFCKEHFPESVRGGVCLGEHFSGVPKIGLAIVTHAIMFQKDLEGLFASLASVLKADGRLVITAFSPTGLFGIAYSVLRALGLQRHVYHNSSFYKVGPYGFVDRRRLLKLAASVSMELVAEERASTWVLASKVRNRFLRPLALALGRVFPESAIYTLKFASAPAASSKGKATDGRDAGVFAPEIGEDQQTESESILEKPRSASADR